MHTNSKFDELLDAVEQLSADEQADLVAVIQKRLDEQGRQRVIDDVRDARLEFEQSGPKVMTADELIREIQS